MFYFIIYYVLFVFVYIDIIKNEGYPQCIPEN